MAASPDMPAVAGLILGAAAGDVPWTDIGPALAGAVGARTHSLWVGDPAAGRVEIVSTSFGPQDEARYNAHYHCLDLWTHRGTADRRDRVMRGTDVVAEDELRRSEFYADFARGLGLFHLAASGGPLGTGGDVLALGLHRPEADRPFETGAVALLGRLMPLLRQGLRLREMLRRETGATVAAMAGFDALGSPALVLDRGGRVHHANDLARSLLAAGRGLASRGGICTPAHPADAEAWWRLLRSAAAGPGEVLRLRPGPDGVALAALAQRPRDARQGGLVLVLLVDPAQRAGGRRAAVLQALHGLTRSEAEVAEAACQGRPAAAIAADRGTSEATVRAQLRSVLDKSGQPNLRALAAAVASLPR